MEQSQVSEKPEAIRQSTNPLVGARGNDPGEPVRPFGLLDEWADRQEVRQQVVRRVIEIRGDQSLDELHHAIFAAYDRWEHHMYEFQFGKRPYDPDGPTYGLPNPSSGEIGRGDRARTTTLDDLKLKVKDRGLGYWFDFGDDWFHQIDVERIEQAIPTVTYPRVVKRVGKSPPQYRDPDEEE